VLSDRAWRNSDNERMKKSNDNKEFIENLKSFVFPEQTLCLIEFDNGKSTNDFIPDEVLEDGSLSNVDWWNENSKDSYLPLARGEVKAIKATPIKEQ